MKFLKLIFWPILVATAAIYAAMLTWTLPAIQSAAGGLPAFDLRPTGYTYEEAMVFLMSLSDDARALYLGPQHMLDLFYPAGIMLTVGIAIFILVPLPTVWKSIFALVAFPGAVYDYRENGAVAALLNAPPEDITREMVEAASFYTVMKSALDTLAFSVLMIFIIIWFYRRLRHRRDAD